MNKYGFENFTFEIIISDKDRSYILNLEKEYIKKHDTQNIIYGYNLSDGGEINIGFKIPDEVRKKRSEMMKGKENHFYGKHHSIETKKKISESKKGKKMSNETIEKMKKRKGSLKGVFGKDHPAFGKKRSAEIRKKIQINTSHRKEVFMVDLETNEIIMNFLSKKDASRWLFENKKTKSSNLRSIASTITRAIKNKSISYGYKWIEVNERQSTIETTSKGGRE